VDILRPVQQKFCYIAIFQKNMGLNFSTVNPHVFSQVEGGIWIRRASKTVVCCLCFSFWPTDAKLGSQISNCRQCINTKRKYI